MKTLQLTDYRCDICKLPSLPGTCELCANRVEPIEQSGFGIVAAIVALAVTVLVFGLWTAARI